MAELNSVVKTAFCFHSFIMSVRRKPLGAAVSLRSAIPLRLAHCGLLTPVVCYELVLSRRLTGQFGFSSG